MGYDEHGQGGLWKRICKDSYKVDKETKEREYLDYPSKMEFSLYYKADRLETTIFSWENEKLPETTEIGPYSRVKFIAAWYSLTRGNFGLTIKPKLMQIKFKKENSNFDVCVFDSDSEEEKDVFYVNPDTLLDDEV